MSFIEFENIYKQYEKAPKPSVTDFNLDIDKGEFIAFVRPSGCGKSTTLRMLASSSPSRTAISSSAASA